MADFTIADVLAWARTKPAERRYDYCDARHCAVAQFGRDTGRDYLIGIGALKEHYRELYELVNPSAYGPNKIEWDNRCTFGALASRLEAVLPAKPIRDTWTKADAYLNDIEQVSA